MKWSCTLWANSVYCATRTLVRNSHISFRICAGVRSVSHRTPQSYHDGWLIIGDVPGTRAHVCLAGVSAYACGNIIVKLHSFAFFPEGGGGSHLHSYFQRTRP